MASNTTLQSTQPKKEVKIHPRDVIGGLFEDAFETLTGSGTGFLNEAPLTKQEFKDIQKWPEQKTAMPDRGSIEFNRRATVVTQEISQISSARSTIDALKAKRQEVNTKIGIGNTSYEDTVREDFTLRVDVQTDIDKANSQLTEKQIKATRKSILATATRGKQKAGSFQMKEGELLMGNERSGGGHWTNNPG